GTAGRDAAARGGAAGGPDAGGTGDTGTGSTGGTGGTRDTGDTSTGSGGTGSDDGTLGVGDDAATGGSSDAGTGPDAPSDGRNSESDPDPDDQRAPASSGATGCAVASSAGFPASSGGSLTGLALLWWIRRRSVRKPSPEASEGASDVSPAPRRRELAR